MSAPGAARRASPSVTRGWWHSHSGFCTASGLRAALTGAGSRAHGAARWRSSRSTSAWSSGSSVSWRLVLALERSFRVLEVRWPRWVQALPGYTVGSLGRVLDDPARRDASRCARGVADDAGRCKPVACGAHSRWPLWRSSGREPRFAHLQAGRGYGVADGFPAPASLGSTTFSRWSPSVCGARSLAAPAIWLSPVAFPHGDGVGRHARASWACHPRASEIGIAASAILLGAAVMFEVRPPLVVAAVLVGVLRDLPRTTRTAPNCRPARAALLYEHGLRHRHRLPARAWASASAPSIEWPWGTANCRAAPARLRRGGRLYSFMWKAFAWKAATHVAAADARARRHSLGRDRVPRPADAHLNCDRHGARSTTA